MLACASMWMATAGAANADVGPIQWTIASGGTGAYYERIDQIRVNFNDAKAAAEARTFNGLPGRLLILETTNYTAERDWVFQNIVSPGAAASPFYWIGATRANSIGPVAESWTWTDGNAIPTSITNAWAVDFAQGNVAYGAGFSSATAPLFADQGRATPDGVTGYVVEYAAIIPGPSAMVIFGVTGLATLRRRSR